MSAKDKPLTRIERVLLKNQITIMQTMAISPDASAKKLAELEERIESSIHTLQFSFQERANAKRERKAARKAANAKSPVTVERVVNGKRVAEGRGDGES